MWLVMDLHQVVEDVFLIDARKGHEGGHFSVLEVGDLWGSQGALTGWEKMFVNGVEQDTVGFSAISGARGQWLHVHLEAREKFSDDVSLLSRNVDHREVGNIFFPQQLDGMVGKLAEVYLWSDPLAPSQVTLLQNGFDQWPGRGGLMAYYRVDEGVGEYTYEMFGTYGAARIWFGVWSKTSEPVLLGWNISAPASPKATATCQSFPTAQISYTVTSSTTLSASASPPSFSSVSYTTMLTPSPAATTTYSFTNSTPSFPYSTIATQPPLLPPHPLPPPPRPPPPSPPPPLRSPTPLIASGVSDVSTSSDSNDDGNDMTLEYIAAGSLILAVLLMGMVGGLYVGYRMTNKPPPLPGVGQAKVVPLMITAEGEAALDTKEDAPAAIEAAPVVPQLEANHAPTEV
ncbi:hypothetical protein CYMTET_51457 [Cymbomonas tetramitiformis]|uniref:Uncharacterized protein n=1 Tax=Cymbomonas tetramitiformis TaxID=36881 RepID=A0AAE0BMW3_9CHLO|nr:hypothetical protein CYMTET_51457 [Cymbomonas tetramitiformis]